MKRSALLGILVALVSSRGAAGDVYVCYPPNQGPSAFVCAMPLPPLSTGLCCANGTSCVVGSRYMQVDCCLSDESPCLGSNGTAKCCPADLPYCVDYPEPTRQRCEKGCPPDRTACGGHQCCSTAEFATTERVTRNTSLEAADALFLLRQTAGVRAHHNLPQTLITPTATTPFFSPPVQPSFVKLMSI